MLSAPFADNKLVSILLFFLHNPIPLLGDKMWLIYKEISKVE